MNIDLLKYQSELRISEENGKKQVFDPIRKKYVALTPEELMRQLLLQYLISEKKYKKGRIRVEKGITVNGQPKRCDILVYDQKLQPWLIVECKSPKVPVTQASLDQVVRYNRELLVPYVAVTNGLNNYCYAVDYDAHDATMLEDYPELT